MSGEGIPDSTTQQLRRVLWRVFFSSFFSFFSFSLLFFPSALLATFGDFFPKISARDAYSPAAAQRRLRRCHGLRGLRELRGEGTRPVRPHSPVQAGAGGRGDATPNREPKPTLVDLEAARAGHGLPRLAGAREQYLAVRAQRMCTVCTACVTPRHTQGPPTSTMPNAPCTSRCRDNPSCRVLYGAPSASPSIEKAGPLVRALRAPTRRQPHAASLPTLHRVAASTT
jgi:hypothetical protein